MFTLAHIKQNYFFANFFISSMNARVCCCCCCCIMLTFICINCCICYISIVCLFIASKRICLPSCSFAYSANSYFFGSNSSLLKVASISARSFRKAILFAPLALLFFCFPPCCSSAFLFAKVSSDLFRISSAFFAASS